jgi:hypothetical protein
LRAPYLEAEMYCREGKFGPCEQKLKEAIALDAWNIHAKKLHIAVLARTQQYEFAIKYSWELLEDYGLMVSPGIVPEELYRIFATYYSNKAVYVTDFEIDVPGSYFPEQIWFCDMGLYSCWKKSGWFVESTLVRGFSWKGEVIFDGPGWKIAAISNTYVFLWSKNVLEVFGIANRRRITTLERSQFESIYGVTGDHRANGTMISQLVANGSTSFSDVVVRRDDYDKTVSETVWIEPSEQIGVPYETTRTRRLRGSRLLVSRRV